MTPTAKASLAPPLIDALCAGPAPKQQAAAQPVTDAPEPHSSVGEPLETADAATPADAQAAAGLPHVHIALGVIAVIALVAALYLARSFFIPLLIGILASYALHPVVNWLNDRHIPRAISAAL